MVHKNAAKYAKHCLEYAKRKLEVGSSGICKYESNMRTYLCHLRKWRIVVIFFYFWGICWHGMAIGKEEEKEEQNKYFCGVITRRKSQVNLKSM